MSQIRVTLKKSLIGRKDDQIATVKALGLRRINHSVVKPDNVAIRGMINKVVHLVEIEEIKA